MKRYIWTLLILAMATHAVAATEPSMQRILATSPKVTVDPTNTATKARPFVAYTSGAGVQFRVAETDSVLELGGVETSAPEGQRYIYPYNGATPFVGTPAMGMLTTTSTGPKWYDGEAWSPIGVGYDDTALWAKFSEYLLLSTHNTYVAATTTRLDNLDTQVAQLKAAMDAHGITVSGIAPATLDALAFGNVVAGQNKTMQTATFQNTGLGDLIMYGASFSGTGQAKFSSSGGCSNLTLAPNATCQEDITFTPGTAGSYTATLSLDHNAAGSPTTVSLSGTGVAIQTCSASPYIDIANSTTTATPVANGTANVYSGLIVDAVATHTVCKAAFYIAAIDGGVSGLSFQAEIRSTDGSKTLNGTAKAVSTAVSGSALSVGSYVVFSFPSPVAMVAGDALVITRTDHGYNTTNFIQVAYSGSSADSGYGHSARWYNTLALGSENTAQDKRIQIYEVQ